MLQLTPRIITSEDVDDPREQLSLSLLLAQVSEAVFGAELVSESFELVGTSLVHLFDAVFFFFCFLWLFFFLFNFVPVVFFLVLFVPFNLLFFSFFFFFVLVVDVVAPCGSILFLSFDCLEGDNLESKDSSSLFALISKLFRGGEESKLFVKSAESLDDDVDDVHVVSDCLHQSELRVS